MPTRSVNWRRWKTSPLHYASVQLSADPSKNERSAVWVAQRSSATFLMVAVGASGRECVSRENVLRIERHLPISTSIRAVRAGPAALGAKRT